MIRREYKFNEAQMGFHSAKGTERAILRYMAGVGKGRKTKAVLDLKAAYGRVPRDTLMQEIRERISANVTAMISHSLQHRNSERN